MLPRHIFKALRYAGTATCGYRWARPWTGRGNRRYTAIGRLTAGVGIEEARRDLERISTDLGTKFPQTNLGNLIDPLAPRRITVAPYSRLDPTVRSQAILIGVPETSRSDVDASKEQR